MKYWIFTTELAPQFSGGIGTYVDETARAMSACGHEVLVILADWANQGRIELRDAGSYQVVAFSPALWSDESGMGDLARLSHAFSNVFAHLVSERGAPDYLETQDYLGIGYFTLQRQLTFERGFPKVPVLVRAHCPSYAYVRANSDPQFKLPNYWIGEMERFCLKAATKVLSPSLFADRVVLGDVPGADIARLPNPMRLAPVTEWDYSGEFVYFARVQALKGIIELLAAFERRFDAGKLDPITVIGASTVFVERQCDLRQYLENKHADAIDAGLINFMGYVPRPKAHAHLSKAKAVLIPSRLETFCYSAAESMALGRVVVASQTGGQADYIKDGESGILISDCSDAAFDRALNRAAALSDGERREIGETGRRVVDEFAPELVVEKLHNILEQLDPKASRTFPVVRQREHTEHPVAVTEPGRLSVVVPAHNMGTMLCETLRSVFSCSQRPLEVIVINDGSTDLASISVLHQLRAPRGSGIDLKVVHQRNQGLARTRNIGAELATGEYLAFLDGDDLVARDYYARAVEVLENYDNVGFVGCWLKYFEGSNGSWLTWNPEPPFLLYHNLINSASVVFRRQEFLAHGLNDPSLNIGMEDYGSIIQLVSAGVAGVAIPERLFNYRVRVDSMMRGFNDVNQVLMYERLAQTHRDVYADYAVELSGLLNANGPGWAYDNPTWATNWRR